MILPSFDLRGSTHAASFGTPTQRMMSSPSLSRCIPRSAAATGPTRLPRPAPIAHAVFRHSSTLSLPERMALTACQIGAMTVIALGSNLQVGLRSPKTISGAARHPP